MRGDRALHATIVATLLWCLSLLFLTVTLIHLSMPIHPPVNELVHHAQNFSIDAYGVKPP